MKHNFPRSRMLRDPQANIRYIGKSDKKDTLEALNTGGEDVILRACIAPGEGMPLRALGYYAILEHLNRVYFPRAQAQLVLTANTAGRVNGPPQKGSRHDSAEQFIEYVAFLPPHPGTKPPLILFDKNDEPLIDTNHLEKILQGTPEEATLKQQAERRSADHLSYLAAHLIMHDTVDCVQRFDHNQPAPNKAAQQIISVGGRAEEPFYKARMRVKAHGLYIPGEVSKTGQLFTGHDTVPPYQFARQPTEGELVFDPPISDVLAVRDLILHNTMRTAASSVLRDLVYLRDYVDYVSEEISRFAITADDPAFLAA